jgi:hypothetical protein
VSAFPGKGRFASKTRPERKETELPPSLAQPAPLTLRCPTCRTLRCATEERIILWHGEWRERKLYECAGAGLPGLDPEEDPNDPNAK